MAEITRYKFVLCGGFVPLTFCENICTTHNNRKCIFIHQAFMEYTNELQVGLIIQIVFDALTQITQPFLMSVVGNDIWSTF